MYLSPTEAVWQNTTPDRTRWLRLGLGLGLKLGLTGPDCTGRLVQSDTVFCWIPQKYFSLSLVEFILSKVLVNSPFN